MATEKKTEVTPGDQVPLATVSAVPAHDIVGIVPGVVYVIGLQKHYDLSKLTAADIGELQGVNFPHLVVK